MRQEDVLRVLLERVVDLAVDRHGRRLGDVVVGRLVVRLVLDRARVLLVEILDRVEHALPLLLEELTELVDVDSHARSLVRGQCRLGGLVISVLLVRDFERGAQQCSDSACFRAQVVALGERSLRDLPSLRAGLREHDVRLAARLLPELLASSVPQSRASSAARSRGRGSGRCPTPGVRSGPGASARSRQTSSKLSTISSSSRSVAALR